MSSSKTTTKRHTTRHHSSTDADADALAADVTSTSTTGTSASAYDDVDTGHTRMRTHHSHLTSYFNCSHALVPLHRLP